jgi:DNA replication protein DnaC
MSTESNRVLLKHHLEKLRLPTIRREWEAVAAKCARDRQDYGDYLLQLTERELIEREQRAAQRRIKNAKFPVLKTLENFDFDAQPSINETLVRQLAGGDYVEGRENVLLIGNSGTGKTHLASALGFAACTQGKRVRFWSATALVTHMLELREQRELKRFLTHIGKHDLLVLDELGYVPFSKAGAELLFEIVSRAYERLSLIVTTNLPFEQWTEVMGSERLTGALLDRLTHRVHIIEANGESYRLKDARKRRKKTREGARVPSSEGLVALRAPHPSEDGTPHS